MDALLKQGRRAQRPGERAVRLPRGAGPLPEGHAVGPALPRVRRSPRTAGRSTGSPWVRPASLRYDKAWKTRMIKTTRPALTLAALLRRSAPAPRTKEDAALREAAGPRGGGRRRRLDGVLGLSLKDLKTGATVMELHPAEPFPTASSIKLAVLYELYRQAEEGRIDLAEVTHPPAAARGGTGRAAARSGTACTLTWRDLAVLMMGWSDNEATNRLIDKVGLDAVNRRLDALRLPHVAAAPAR